MCDRKVNLAGDINVEGPLRFMRSSMGVKMLGMFSELGYESKPPKFTGVVLYP